MDDSATDSNESLDTHSCVDEAMIVPVVVKFARARPRHIPRPESGSYHDFKICQMEVLRNAISHLYRELGPRTGVASMAMGQDELIIEFHSQSKLSQQELSDLQKATHFDKKELQQWYKGMLVRSKSDQETF